MIRYVMAGLLSLASLVPVTASAEDELALSSCRTYCTYGQCGPCMLSTFETDCFMYNGCGGKYPIPVAPEMEELQASNESTSTSEEVLVCAPQAQGEVQG